MEGAPEQVRERLLNGRQSRGEWCGRACALRCACVRSVGRRSLAAPWRVFITPAPFPCTLRLPTAAQSHSCIPAQNCVAWNLLQSLQVRHPPPPPLPSGKGLVPPPAATSGSLAARPSPGHTSKTRSNRAGQAIRGLVFSPCASQTVISGRVRWHHLSLPRLVRSCLQRVSQFSERRASACFGGLTHRNTISRGIKCSQLSLLIDVPRSPRGEEGGERGTSSPTC